MEFRYETHCHSSACSRCAHSTPEELVRAYHQKGFAGMVLTDHFVHGNTCVDASLPWEIRMKQYYDAYLQAKAVAESLDFDVIFGIEHAYGSGLEALCYGIDLDFLLENRDLASLSIEDFSKRVHQWDGMLVQAHPYRYGGRELRFPLDYLDGIEVYNAGNSPEKNLMAMQLALCSGLIMTSGSDLHRSDEPRLGIAGISLPYRIQSGKELVEALRRKDHRLIFPDEPWR